MARLDISFAVSNLPTQINACNISARTLAEGPTRPKYSSNHIIMLHCYSNAAINKKEVYLHYIPRDIQVADISTKHIAQPIYHTEKQAAQLCQHIILGQPQFYFSAWIPSAHQEIMTITTKIEKNMNTECEMTMELKRMQNEDNTRRIILQPHKFIFFFS